ncbi:MAG: hypothetical protein QXT99_09705 [Candidatus Nitrosotenuis sp.]
MLIRNSNCYIFYVIMNIIIIGFVPHLSYPDEHFQPVYAFYCPSEEIPFIGELMFSTLPILEDNNVKAELGLSNTQLEKMREIDKEFVAGIKDVLLVNKGGNTEITEKKKEIKNHVIAIGKLTEDARKRTSEVLKPYQLRRMKELLLEKKGLLFIPRKDLVPLLRLDKKQERIIDEIRSNIFKKIDETASPDSVIASAEQCKLAMSTSRDLAVLLEESEKTIYNLLTPDQKANFEKLKVNSLNKNHSE